MLLWNEMTRDDIGQIAPQATAVIPVGAIEQHGPHLPVMTDAFLIEAIARQSVAKLASAAAQVVLAPCMPFGFSHHHLIYPGALSLGTDRLIAVLQDLVDSIVQSGFKKIFLLNGHGGNEECVRITARNTVLKHPVTIGAASYWTIAWEEMTQYAEEHQLYGVVGHAGLFETSMMLALRPDLVKLEQLTPFNRPKPDYMKGKPLLERPRIERPSSWADIDGFTDYPQAATADIGHDLLELISKAVAGQLASYHQS